MKTKSFLTLGILILLSACKNDSPAEKEYYASLDQLTPEQRMSGRKARLLYGHVSKVNYDDGRFEEFNEDGNPTREKIFRDGDVKTYRYVNPKRYFLSGDPYPYNIIYDDSMRVEEWDTREKLNTHYVFDEKGRVKEYGIYDYHSVSEYYHYKGNALLPFKIVTIIGDESGESVTTSLHTYTKTDSRGNWLECKVKTSTVDKESGYDDAKGEETVVETRRPVEHETRARTIEYFSDGDAPDAPAEVDGFKKWPPKKFPCDIPFKALEKNGRKLAWNIESITCTGPAEDKRGYRFTVRGTGVTDSRKYTPGSRTLTFVPEEKGSTSIDMSLAAAYSFPGVDAGDPFAFEFKGLFPGYYHEDLFAGFLIFDD